MTHNNPYEAPINEQVAQTYQRKRNAAGLSETIATVEYPIQRTYETRFHHESRVGNFISDAYRWATDADVGMVAGGSIRLGPPLCGLITVGDIIGVVPFENPLTVARVKGVDLQELFRDAEGGGPDDEPPWWHLHVSGASVVWNHMTKELVEVRINDDIVSTDRNYTLATSEFLFHGDSFTSLSEEDIIDRYDIQYNHVVDYARKQGIEPEIEGRIKRHNLPE